jgi:hypothetical protein
MRIDTEDKKTNSAMFKVGVAQIDDKLNITNTHIPAGSRSYFVVNILGISWVYVTQLTIGMIKI